MKKNFVLRSLLAIMLLFVGLNTAWAEEITTKYSFSSYAVGTQYAQGEEHKLDDNVTLIINGAHLNDQVRLYAGSNAVFKVNGSVTKLVVSAGNKAGTLTINGSNDGATWTKINSTSTTKSYKEYTFEIPNYSYVQMASTGAQIRVSIATLTYTTGEGGGDEVIVAQPTFNPAAGAVTKGTEVELSCETVDATIYYALGESDDFVEYNEAITINEATTIKAYAKLGDAQSATVSATYTIAKLAVPTFTPQGGMVAAGTEVTISHADDGATIKYLIKGGEYNDYTDAIVVNEETTITAYATKEGYDDSDKVTAEYTILPEGTSVGTIVFKTSSSDSSTAAKTTNFVTGQVVSTDFTDLSCTATNNCYTGKSGLKMSSGSTNGSFSLDLGKTLNVTQIVVNAVRYGSDAAAMSVNGSGSQSLTATAADYTFDINKEISTIKVDMTKRGYIASITVNYVTASTPDPEEVAVPTFDIASGETVKMGDVVTITSAEGTTLWYTVGEEEYNVDTNIAEVTIPTTENKTVTIEAAAVSGDDMSEVATVTYNIAKLANPTVNVQGAVVANTEVTISAEEGATLVYTLNNNVDLLEAVAPLVVTITEETVIEVYATKVGYLDSEVETFSYTIKELVAPGSTIADVLTADKFAATSTTYTDFSNVSVTSDAVYAGNNSKTSGGAIQLRSKNSNSGIVTTKSGGRVKSITIKVESGSNTLDIYGKNSAYSSAADLYDSGAQGTKLGSLNADGTLTITGDYEYIGLRSKSGAMYLDEIQIEWYKPYPENIVCEQNYYLDVEGSDWTIAVGNSLAACFVNKNTDATTWSVGEYLAANKHYVFYLSQYNVPTAAPARAKAEETPVYTHVKFVNFKGATDALTPWVDGTPVNETAELTYTPAVGYEYTIYSVAGSGAWVGKNDISTGLEAVEADGMVYAGNVVVAEGAIEVYNLSGAVVARGNNRVDLNGLAGGVYVVRCGNDVLKVVR